MELVTKGVDCRLIHNSEVNLNESDLMSFDYSRGVHYIRYSVAHRSYDTPSLEMALQQLGQEKDRNK